MNILKIIKNMFFNKLYFFLLVVSLVSIFLLIFLFDATVKNYAQEESNKNYIIRSTIITTYLNKYDLTNDKDFYYFKYDINKQLKSSDLLNITFFDKNKKLIYSSTSNNKDKFSISNQNVVSFYFKKYKDTQYIGTYRFDYKMVKFGLNKFSKLYEKIYILFIILFIIGLIVLYYLSKHELMNKFTNEKLKLLNDNLKEDAKSQLCELRKQDSIILNQSKQVALGEMIEVISHQWKQPLCELNLNNIYIKEIADNPLLDETIQSNEEIVDFMSNTLSNFESFYENSVAKKFNLSDSVNESINLLKKSIEKQDITLIVDMDNTLEIYGKNNSFSQVVLTILQNAIEVFSEREINNKYLKILLFKNENNNIILKISDNAKGISIENVMDIFELSISFKRNRSSGMGLYLAKMIIEDKFSGKISAQNTKEGVSFEICL